MLPQSKASVLGKRDLYRVELLKFGAKKSGIMKSVLIKLELYTVELLTVPICPAFHVSHSSAPSPQHYGLFLQGCFFTVIFRLLAKVNTLILQKMFSYEGDTRGRAVHPELPLHSPILLYTHLHSLSLALPLSLSLSIYLSIRNAIILLNLLSHCIFM